MRRHHGSIEPASTSTTLSLPNSGRHNRRQSPVALNHDILPTTLHSTVALQNAEDTALRHQDDGNKKRASMMIPTLLIQRDGVLTFHPVLIKGFFILGGMVLLAIHVFLLWEMMMTADTKAPPDLPVPQHQKNDNQLILTKLGPRDREQYTIRINTWQRHEQLAISIDHHASCPGVAQIQVVWCEPQDPPDSLLQLHPDKVIFERHQVNSLNERFHILPTTKTPTVGILSMDDDVLRPCQAIDSGFFQWTQSPSRMVGFDYRVHVENDNGSWKYGYLSTTQKGNRYSMSLPRYAFLHRDYLDLYMTQLPRPIFDQVAEHFNCEDIAMSFLISSRTKGRPPLLAHFWSIESMIKLHVPKRISGTKDHKALRDACVESFAQHLDLKGRLYAAPILYRNDTMFYCGDKHYHDDDDDKHKSNLRQEISNREEDLTKNIRQWKKFSNKHMAKFVSEMKANASANAKLAGLIEHTEEWTARFRNAHEK
ncbi:Exostosin-like 3 [Seminavis robusta]|uniref:Exostosin-like 3 n=1 Tax=Seminavis robusta TaxID=568900 RepID=A0A9N8EA42_9STRA|nr:Exostosin-like 3 [Seminavis robusta]|eukprot:Sro848_g210470.1 Exostosin-like 3 (482) ;mRNA; f:36153-37598